MRRFVTPICILTVLGLVLATLLAIQPVVRDTAGQAAGVGGITVISVVLDDPTDPRFPSPYNYLIDAGTIDGVTPSASRSETYQLYDSVTGDILDTQPVGADGTVELTFRGGPNGRQLININDISAGSAPVGATDTVTVVINPGSSLTQPPPEVARSTEVPLNPIGTTQGTTEDTSRTDGSTAAIYAGDCEGELTGEPVATLTNVRPPDGDQAGADTASAVETSFTTLDLPLDDILANDHVLVIFDQDDDTVPLACGAIGGIVTDDGTLAFGLPAVGESRFSGVAYLTEVSDQTQATIFLAEDLDGDEETPAA